MDFFEHKAEAKRKTLWLYLLFAVAVAVIIVAVYAAVTVSHYLLAASADDIQAPLQFWEMPRFVLTSVITALVILMGSSYKIHQLKQGGGEAIARMLGGRRLKNSKDPIERQLRNVIEEMAIASGVLTPAIYIIEQRGINAFAAGYEQNDTVIAVTRGAMEMLNRDELQGVVAHEFSHILHGDTAIKMRMMGLLHGITMISDFGILLIAGRNSTKYSSRERATHPVMMLSGMLFFIVGLLGMLAADLIKAAMSRQREFLADASAVQFTRNPEGIGNALKVIGGYKSGSRLNLPEIQQVSHLFFGEALQVWWQSNWWATHPPLETRIKRIEPAFRGRIEKVDEERVRFQNKSLAASLFSPPPGRKQLHQSVDQVMQSIGEPSGDNLQQAQHLLQQIPESVHEVLSEPESARAMVYVLLLDDDKSVYNEQLQLISQNDTSRALREVVRIRGVMPQVATALRLPLIDLVSSHLMRLEKSERKRFLMLMKRLIGVNHSVSFFEYLTYQHFLHFFEFKGGQKSEKFIPVEQFKSEVSIVLSMLCHLHDDKPAMTQKPKHTFQDALALLFPGYKVKAESNPGIKSVSESLEKLNLCSFEDKKRILNSVVYCVLSDGVISAEEVETVRLIATVLSCPMPVLALE